MNKNEAKSADKRSAIKDKPGDNTEDRASGMDMTKKRPPLSKAPLNKSSANLKGKEPPLPGKMKKKSGKGLILLIIIVVLIGATAAVLYYTGKLTPILESIGLVGAEAETEALMSAEELNAWKLKLDLRETEIKEKEEELLIKEQQLADKEKELIVKENNLKIYGQSGQYEEEYTETFQEMLGSLTEEEINYYKRISTVYSKMDPAEAASVIVQLYDIQKTSAIIYYMQPSASALILQQMDEATAADITETILN